MTTTKIQSTAKTFATYAAAHRVAIELIDCGFRASTITVESGWMVQIDGHARRWIKSTSA